MTIERTRTNEGDLQYINSGNSLLEFFSKAGSAFENQKSFYKNKLDTLSMFKDAWKDNNFDAFRLMLWVRDCRGGAGNRSGFRKVLFWMANNNSDWVKLNIEWIPKIGRWDDLRSLYKTKLENFAANYWWNAINNGDVLAAKWCDRNDYPVRKASGMKIGAFRRFLAKIRKEHIVEYKMCSKKWNEIEYSSVPSVAMARYASAFNKNDSKRFKKFKEDVKHGVKKVNTDVIFPHDCVRTVVYGDKNLAELQFDNLPVYAPDNSMTMVICDTSGSMTCSVGGSIRAIDISIGLSLYFSSKVSKNNPFYKRFIKFCYESKFVDWRGLTFKEAVFNRKIFDGAIGSTRVDLALKTILDIAINKNIPQRLMPKNLIIISDMQFSDGCLSDESSIEYMLKEFDKAGYKRPNIIYWNVSSYSGSPSTSTTKNVALISGFSPSILKSVLECESLNPMKIMYKTLDKYSEIEVPSEY